MKSENLTRRYLVGDMSPEEKSRFEEEFFSDSEIFEELLSVENDLVDDYALGRLTDADRMLFERAYLRDPNVALRVEFARDLLAGSLGIEQATDQANPPQEALSYLGMVVGLVMGCALINEAFITTRGLVSKFCFFAAAFLLLGEVAILAVQHAYRALLSRPIGRQATKIVRYRWPS